MSKPPVVFVHGLFVTRACWKAWAERYEACGHRCIVPAYPHRELAPAELRARHPDPETAAVTLPAVIDVFARVIRDLDRPPILIGHSFGGLLVQLLLQRQLGACGVAIDSVPPPGVFTLQWSFLRSLAPPLNPLVSGSRPYLMSLRHFCYTFVNTLPPDQQSKVYDAHVAPESRRLARAALGRGARIDFNKHRPPLLLVAGSKDHIIPSAVNRKNWQRYRRSTATTDFQEFPGRDHFLIGAPGWEEIADYALRWATVNAAMAAPSASAPASSLRAKD